jgi:hypothetical protein
LTLSGFLLLTACAGMSYALENYGDVKVQEITMKDDTYRIFDKPKESRMMVTSSIGGAMMQGGGKGLTLNTVDTTPPLPMFRAAARAWLNKTGRSHCKITDGYLILNPQYEFNYSCR